MMWYRPDGFTLGGGECYYEYECYGDSERVAQFQTANFSTASTLSSIQGSVTLYQTDDNGVLGASDVPGAVPTFNRVPEPGTLALVGLALAGFAASSRRKSMR